jgi:hypothetical protein
LRRAGTFTSDSIIRDSLQNLAGNFMPIKRDTRYSRDARRPA